MMDIAERIHNVVLGTATIPVQLKIKIIKQTFLWFEFQLLGYFFHIVTQLFPHDCDILMAAGPAHWEHFYCHIPTNWSLPARTVYINPHTRAIEGNILKKEPSVNDVFLPRSVQREVKILSELLLLCLLMFLLLLRHFSDILICIYRSVIWSEVVFRSVPVF